MSRINTNVPALVSQRALRQNQQSLQLSLERLSTGLRINRGADDPAGLMNSEKLRADISSTNKAISNSQRASNFIATSEGALNEISSLLIDMQGLIIQAANDAAMSDEEKKANQLQIDSAIDAITRIANSTTYAGRNPLNGSLSYSTSGVQISELPNVNITGAQFGTLPKINVNVQVTASAQKGQLLWQHDAVPTGQQFYIKLSGANGATIFNWNSGVTGDSIITAVNAASEATGVEAVWFNDAHHAEGIVFRSTQYGSDQFVSIQNMSTTTTSLGIIDNRTGATAQSSSGQDAVALINGISARGRGLNLSLNSRTLDMNLTLSEALGTNPGSTSSFAITGGGALFQVGPEVTTNHQAFLGIQSVAATELGNNTVGFLSQIATGGPYAIIDGINNCSHASDIVSEAIRQVAVLRGRLGAFERSTLQSNINSLTVTMDNLTASDSAIRDTDFAEETSKLSRAQILVNAGTSILAMANVSSQNILSLLKQ